MPQSTLDEMRRLLEQMNRLESRVLSLQDTISTFRSDVKQQIGSARDGGRHEPTPDSQQLLRPQAATRQANNR